MVRTTIPPRARRLVNHRVLMWIAAVGSMTLPFAVSALQGQDDASATEKDLQGIIPEFVPSGITDTDFAQLGPSWAQWSEETGGLVIDFYSSDDPEVQGRRATLDQLAQRVAIMERALDDPRYAGIHLPLVDLYSRLAPRVAILRALLDTMELDLAATGQRHAQAARGRLAQAAQGLERHLRSIPKGDAWLPFLRLQDVLAATQAQAAPGDFGALLQDAQKRLASRTTLEESQRAFMSTEPFLAYEDALASAAASLVAEDPQQYQTQMRSLAAALVLAIEEYEEAPLSAHTRAIRTAYDEIRRTAPDGGARLTEEMRRFYLNYNTRAMVDEALVQSLFNESRMESSFVNQMTEQARVTGCQWTNTHAYLDLKPSGDGVRFDLCMRGNIRASLQGNAHVATVNIAGRYGFDGRKEVFFDGRHFHTRPARVSVYANNQPTGARTKFSWVPILGRMSENIAMREAREQIPEANARTRQQIYQEAKPRFDREASQKFYEAELELERKINGPLREQGLYADAMHFSSSERDLIGRTRLMEAGELGGAATFPLAVFPAHGVLMQFHESMLNNAAQRFELEGKTFTPDELNAYITSRLERLTGRNIDLSSILPSEDDDAEAGDQPRVETVVFANEDAMRVQLDGGRVKLFLRIGLNLEGRDPIPPQSISIELYPTLVNGRLHLRPGDTIGVEAIEEVAPADRLEQITRSNVMRAKMQDLFEPRDLKTVYSFNLQNKTLTLRLTDLKLRGGWFSAVLSDGVWKGQMVQNESDETPIQTVSIEESFVGDRAAETAPAPLFVTPVSVATDAGSTN